MINLEEQHLIKLVLEEENVEVKQMDAIIGIGSGIIVSLVVAFVLIIGLNEERITNLQTSGFKYLVYWVALLTCLLIGNLVCSYYFVQRWSEMPKQVDNSVHVQ